MDDSYLRKLANNTVDNLTKEKPATKETINEAMSGHSRQVRRQAARLIGKPKSKYIPVRETGWDYRNRNKAVLDVLKKAQDARNKGPVGVSISVVDE